MILSSTLYASLTLTSAIRAVRMVYQGKGSSPQEVIRKAQSQSLSSDEFSPRELPAKSEAPTKPVRPARSELLAVSGTFDIIL